MKKYGTLWHFLPVTVHVGLKFVQSNVIGSLREVCFRHSSHRKTRIGNRQGGHSPIREASRI